jgi:hypothetical protein
MRNLLEKSTIMIVVFFGLIAASCSVPDAASTQRQAVVLKIVEIEGCILYKVDPNPGSLDNYVYTTICPSGNTVTSQMQKCSRYCSYMNKVDTVYKESE